MLAIVEPEKKITKRLDSTKRTIKEKYIDTLDPKKLSQAVNAVEKLIVHYRKGEERIMEEMVVTPFLAAALFLRNDEKNRKLRADKLKIYAQDIVDGYWRVNGESIKVRRDGVLGDGQHRLAAILIKGIPIKTFVGFNFEKEDLDTVDQGIQRSAGTQLSMADVPQFTNVAAAAKIYLILSNPDSKLRNPDKSTRHLADPASTPSSTAIQRFALKNKGWILENVNFFGQKGQLVASNSRLAGLKMLIESKCEDKEAVCDFFTRLRSGTGVDEKSPIWQCRQVLGEALHKGRQTPLMAAENIMRAWNLYRTGSTKKLRTVGELPAHLAD